MSLTLSLDAQYTTSIEELWSALTDSSKLTKWITENDFKPVVGHRFQFHMQPTKWWDGVIDCEMLVVDEPTRLSYTGAGGGQEYTLTFTLQDAGDGKLNLNLEQTGFLHEHGVQSAKYNWGKLLRELEKVLAQ